MSSNRPLTIPKISLITVMPIDFDGTAIKSTLQKIADDHKSSMTRIQSLLNKPTLDFYKPVPMETQESVVKLQRSLFENFPSLFDKKPFFYPKQLETEILLNQKLM